MKLMRYLLMYVAATLMLAHSLVPHFHVQQNSSETHVEQHEDASSLLDYLTLAFHHEQYDGQLEIYVASDATEVNFDLDQSIITSDFDFVSPNTTSSTEVPAKKYGDHSLFASSEAAIQTYSLRGPPNILS